MRAALLLALVLVARVGLADGSRRVRVDGANEGCPRADEVAERLRPMLSGIATVDQGDPGAQSIRVVEDGATFRIIVDGVTRELTEAATSCSDRADAAAVSIALLLAPAPAPPIVVVTPKDVPPRPPPPREPMRVEIEADLRIAGSGQSGPGFGGGLRLVLARGHVGGSLGVGALSPVSLSLTTGSVSLTRVPFDLSLHGRGRFGRWGLDGALGFVTTVDWAEGRGVPLPIARAGVDLGLRVALQGRLSVTSRVALFAALEAVAIPAPLELAFHDEGVVGKTPKYWIAGALGVGWRAR